MTFFGGIFMGQEFGFASTQTIVLVAIAIVSFILFLVIEKKKENPLIHFAIFKNADCKIKLDK